MMTTTAELRQQVAQMRAVQRGLHQHTRQLSEHNQQQQQQQMYQTLVSKLNTVAQARHGGVERPPIRRGKEDADVDRVVCHVHATTSTQQCLERAAQLPVFTSVPIVCRWMIDPKRGMIVSVLENAALVAAADHALAIVRQQQSTRCGTVSLMHDEDTNARVQWLGNQCAKKA